MADALPHIRRAARRLRPRPALLRRPRLGLGRDHRAHQALVPPRGDRAADPARAASVQCARQGGRALHRRAVPREPRGDPAELGAAVSRGWRHRDHVCDGARLRGRPARRARRGGGERDGKLWFCFCDGGVLTDVCACSSSRAVWKAFCASATRLRRCLPAASVRTATSPAHCSAPAASSPDTVARCVSVQPSGGFAAQNSSPLMPGLPKGELDKPPQE